MPVNIDKSVEPFNVSSPNWKMSYLNEGGIENKVVKEKLNLEETERELAYAMQKAVMFTDIKSIELHFFKQDEKSIVSQVNLKLSTQDIAPSLDGKFGDSEVGECKVVFSREKLKSLSTEEFIDFASDVRTTASWSITDLKNLRLQIFMKSEWDYVELNDESITEYLSGEPVVKDVPADLKPLMRAYVDEFAKDRHAIWGERITLSKRINSTLRAGYVSYWTQETTTESNSYYVSSLAKNLNLVSDNKKNLPVALDALGILIEFAPAQKNLTTLVNKILDCIETKQEKVSVYNVLYQIDKMNPTNTVFKSVEKWDEVLDEVGNAEWLKVNVERNNSEIHYVISENRDVAFASFIASINAYKKKSGFSLSSRDVVTAMLDNKGDAINSKRSKSQSTIDDIMLKSKHMVLAYGENIIGFDKIIPLNETGAIDSGDGFKKLFKLKLDENFDKLCSPEEKAEVIKDFLEKSIILLRDKVNLISMDTSTQEATLHFDRNDVQQMYKTFVQEQDRKRLNALILNVANENKCNDSQADVLKPVFKL